MGSGESSERTEPISIEIPERSWPDTWIRPSVQRMLSL